MIVTVQNHIDPKACERDETTVADLTLAAEHLRACLPDSMTVAADPSRRGQVRHVIAGLIDGGIRPGAVPGWLLVVLALLDVMPDLLAVIRKILDAIDDGLRPADVLAESR